MKRLVLADVALAAIFLMLMGTAMGAGVKVCVPSKEGKPLVTPKAGVCKSGYTLTELGEKGEKGAKGEKGERGERGEKGEAGLSSEEQAVLKVILPHIKYIPSGIGGKPTIQFTGVNVQIVDGEGKTRSVDGMGNLIIGYDEHSGGREQTGSHNLVLGEQQEFTSWGGIVAGLENSITDQWASVVGGAFNIASNFSSSVTGGNGNTASGAESSVSAGELNVASGEFAFIGGGGGNTASGEAASIFGGNRLTAPNAFEAIP